MMSFSGVYEQQSTENFEPFMKVMGLTDDVIEMVKGMKRVTEIVQNGNHFVITITTGPSVHCDEFTIGEEKEMSSLTAEKVRSTVHLVDGKLVVQLKSVNCVTELSGDILTSIMTVNDIVYKSISKRVYEKTQ